MEPREPVHRVARRAADPAGGAGGAAADARWPTRGCASTTSHTSVLTRAVTTQHLALDELGQVWLPVRRSGVSTSVTTERCRGSTRGDDRAARRRADPSLAAQLRRAAAAGRRCRVPSTPRTIRDTGCSPPDVLPAPECLGDVVARALPYWHDVVAPQLLAGLNVLVTAHGNSLRALLKHLEHVVGRRHRRRQHPDRRAAAATRSTTTRGDLAPTTSVTPMVATAAAGSRLRPARPDRPAGSAAGHQQTHRLERALGAVEQRDHPPLEHHADAVR